MLECKKVIPLKKNLLDCSKIKTTSSVNFDTIPGWNINPFKVALSLTSFQVEFSGTDLHPQVERDTKKTKQHNDPPLHCLNANLYFLNPSITLLHHFPLAHQLRVMNQSEILKFYLSFSDRIIFIKYQNKQTCFNGIQNALVIAV